MGEEEDAVDQMAVCGALYLEVAEEDVCAEEGERFVEDIVRFRLWVDVYGVGACGKGGERISWSAGLGSQREEGKVAYEDNELVVGLSGEGEDRGLGG